MSTNDPGTLYEQMLPLLQKFEVTRQIMRDELRYHTHWAIGTILIGIGALIAFNVFFEFREFLDFTQMTFVLGYFYWLWEGNPIRKRREVLETYKRRY